MDRIIRQITDQLVSRLPENENYYRIQNLDAFGFPAFLIRRIHIELKWNLDESMILPETDWANTQSEAVQQSWQRFLNAIHAEVQLPASYARAVIETAVADVIEILIQPRKNIPEILFGGEEVLTANELAERTELLVVYPHFAHVLSTYMVRKNKEKLERERCKKIIEEIDKKITGQYTPLQWAQMLDPLFTIGGNTIDTNVFRLFFEDKNRPRLARQFDLMNETITRAVFIEVLSSPDVLNYEGYEPDQSELFSGEKEEENNKQQDALGQQVKSNDNGPADDTASEKDEVPLQEDPAAFVSTDDEETVSPVQEAPADAEEENEDHTKDTTLNSGSFESEDIAAADESPEQAALNEIFVGEDSEEEDEEPETAAPVDESDDMESIEEDGAIWQRFLADDDGQDELDEMDEPLYDEEYLDEPIIDFTESGDGENPEKEKLSRLLSDEKDYYIEEIFGGSEEAYDESLEEIVQQDDWKGASKLIERNIFKRNMVNIYSEPAVDFTDRLQTYFLNK